MTTKTPEQIAAEIYAQYESRRDNLILTPEGYKLDLIAAIEADRAQRSPYLLSFEPDAIRDHFAVDDPDPTESMADEQLEAVALDALQDDRLYNVFHELLNEGVNA